MLMIRIKWKGEKKLSRHVPQVEREVENVGVLKNTSISRPSTGILHTYTFIHIILEHIYMLRSAVWLLWLALSVTFFEGLFPALTSSSSKRSLASYIQYVAHSEGALI